MNFKSALLTISLLALSVPAFAGTVVNNSTSNRNVYGKGNNQSVTIRTTIGEQHNNSQSIKVESYAPNATAIATLKDGKLSGTAFGSTSPINPDPIAIVTTSNQTENINFKQLDVANSYEQYVFTGNEYSHSVSSDSF